MKQKLNIPPIPMEKMIYLFIVIANILAILMLFDFSNFIESMLIANVIILAIFKFERVATFYITISRSSKKK